MTTPHSREAEIGDLVPALGVNAETGAYGQSLLRADDVVAAASAKPLDRGFLSALQRWLQALSAKHLGTRHGIDPCDLGQAGWAVVFGPRTDPAVREALAPLLELRREQASALDERFFRILDGDAGYRDGESRGDLLARHGAGFGQADPAAFPYYIALVGEPSSIPLEVQHQLDVQYAVGRLSFDTAEDYATYAANVVAAEKGTIAQRRHATFFGACSPADAATQLTSRHLVQPLRADFAALHPDWQVDSLLDGDATKQRFLDHLTGPQPPSLLFAASHGMEFHSGSPRQRPRQGAILCSDWPGPEGWQGAIPPEMYLSAEDITADVSVGGTIALFFACYGGGTPRLDSYTRGAEAPREIAPEPFVARLPQRLLTHPKGGALAVCAHVDRGFCYSFLWPKAGRELQAFEDALRLLAKGAPVGHAMDGFGMRYAELSTELNRLQEKQDYGAEVDAKVFTRLWTSTNDARCWAVLGDPAVRISGAAVGAPGES